MDSFRSLRIRQIEIKTLANDALLTTSDRSIASRRARRLADVKPANVFLSRNLKVVKLGDFGVAKRLSHVNDLANTVVGTPLYMSPELCAGKPYTYAADVWALGCVVLELALGGKKAFESRGYGELLVKISRNDYAPVPSRYSRPFAALVGSMLAPDPRERPTAEALLNTAIARRHCDALLAEVAGGGGVGGVGAGAGTTLGLGLGLGLGGAARSSRTPSRAMGREAPSAAAVLAAEEASRSIARVQSLLLGGGGGDGVGGSTDRGGAADRGAGASPAAAAEAEKQRIAEKRHDARQRASRRARNAVREADPRRIAAQIKAEEENLRRVEAQERRAVAAAEEELLRRAGSFGLGEDDDDDAVAVAVAGMGEDGVERRGVVAFASRPRLERTIAAPSPNVPRDRDAAAAAATEPEPYHEPEPDAETALMEALLAEARIDLESEITSRDRESTAAVDIATVDIPVSLATIDVPAPEDAARFAATFAATSNRVGTAPAGGGRCRRGSGHVAGVPIVSASWDCERARADRQHARDAALERHVRAKLRSFLRRSDDVAAENAAADVASDVASGSDVASDNFRQFPLSGSFTYLSAAALGEEDGDEETEEEDDVVASPRPATAGAMLGGGGRRREDGDAAALERDEEDEDEDEEEEDEEEEYAYSDFEEDFGSCLGDSDDDDDDGGE